MLILREANTGCTYIKSPVRASVWPPLCFICIKNFHFQMYISPWLNSVAQGWTGLPCSSLTCSTDLYLVWVCHCQHKHFSLLSGPEMRIGEQGGNHLLLACLYSESWDLLCRLRCAGWCNQLKDWQQVQRAPFFSPYRHCTGLYLSCHVCLCAFHNLGGVGLGFF